MTLALRPLESRLLVLLRVLRPRAVSGSVLALK